MRRKKTELPLPLTRPHQDAYGLKMHLPLHYMPLFRTCSGARFGETGISGAIFHEAYSLSE